MVNMVNGTRTLIAMSESHISECTIRPLLEGGGLFIIATGETNVSSFRRY